MAKERAGSFLVASYEPERGRGGVPLGKLHDWILSVRERNGAPFEGDASVSGDMPLHMHGLPSEPLIEALGKGRFRVDGLRFHMPGWWVMTFTFRRKQGASDTISFNLMLP